MQQDGVWHASEKEENMRYYAPSCSCSWLLRPASMELQVRGQYRPGSVLSVPTYADALSGCSSIC